MKKLKDNGDASSEVSNEFSDSERPAITYILEGKAMKAVDKKVVHPDDWPIVMLEDASVHHKNGTLANLLNAELQGPFTVRGRMLVDDEHMDLLTKKKFNGRYVEISSCFVYSIGFPTALWVAGLAGWYEITPSPKYYTMFKTMTEAINMYYFATDIYEESLVKKHKVPSLDDLFYKYALQDGTGLHNIGSTSDMVSKRFKVHAEFLLGQIRKSQTLFSKNGKQKLEWQKTPLYAWLIAEVPEIYRKYEHHELQATTPVENIIAQSGNVSMASHGLGKPLPDHRLHVLSSPKSSDKSAHKKLRTSRTNTEASKAAPKDTNIARSVPAIVVEVSDSDGSNANGTVQLLTLNNKNMRWKAQSKDQRPRDVHIILKFLEESIPASERNNWTIRKLGNRLYFDYSIGISPMGQMIVRACAKDLVKSLDESWRNTTFFKDLQDAAAMRLKPITESMDDKLRSIVPEFRLVKRKTKEPKENGTPGQGKANDQRKPRGLGKRLSTSGSQTPAIFMTIQTRTGSGKVPGLRPPHSSKHKVNPVKSLLEITSDEERELIENTALSNLRPVEVEQPTKSGLGSRKRKRAFSPSHPERTPPPANRSRPDLTSWNGEPDISSASVTPEPEASGQAIRNPELPPLLQKKDKLELTLVTSRLPTIDSQTTGPRCTFRCEQRNCTYTIDNAEENEGVREKIRAHWRWHADVIERVQLDVERELNIRNASGGKDLTVHASHLMEKIMAIGRGIREREGELTASGVGLPVVGKERLATGGQMGPERIKRAGIA